MNPRTLDRKSEFVVENLLREEQVPSNLHYPVSKKDLLDCREYKDILPRNDPAIPAGETINIAGFASSGQQCGERLGLHFTNQGTVRPSHFVGAVWLGKKGETPLVVGPKIEGIDAVRMLTRVMSFGGELGNLKNIFWFDPDAPLIEATPLPELSLLQIAVFLRRLSEFCRNDLRPGFIQTEENLSGKVKGRILIKKNLLLNGLRGRADRACCRYQVSSMDTKENQILKRALWICLGVLGSSGQNVPEKLWDWAKQCEAALAPVSLQDIDIKDFRGIVYSGFMARYREPHRLAKMIIRRFRVDAEGVFEPEPNKTVPFWLDMNKLFERYVGVKLTEMGLKLEYQGKKSLECETGATGTGKKPKIEFVPDYVSTDRQVIIDAKYKRVMEETSNKETGKNGPDVFSRDDVLINNSDIFQIIAYANLLPQSERKNRKDEEIIWPEDLVLAVPAVSSDIESAEKFENWEQFKHSNKVLRFIIKLPDQYEIKLSYFPCDLPKKDNALFGNG